MNNHQRPNAPSPVAAFPRTRAEKTKLRNKAEVGDKIRKYRMARALTQPQLAAILGVTKNAVSNWEAGITRPEFSTITKLCQALAISADTFLGLSIQTGDLSAQEYHHVKLYRSLNKPHQRSVDILMGELLACEQDAFRETCDAAYRHRYASSLPASAGTGMPLTDDDDDREDVFLRNCFAVDRSDEIIRVSGDSMCPTFCDGDMLLIEHTPSVEPGEVGIFIVAGEGFVKEYQPDGLHSHNPAYKTIHPTQDDNVRCIGRVLGKVTDELLPSAKELTVLREMYDEGNGNE